jgi:hypothetical protein
MSRAQCPREPEIVEAIRRGALPEDLRGHAESCPDCREARAVALRLRELAKVERPTRLPAAGQLWWRAEVIRRLTAEAETAAQAARPALWGTVLGLLVAAGGLVLSFALGADLAPRDFIPIAFVLGSIPLVLLLLLGALTRET